MNKASWIKKNITMIKVGVRNGSFSYCLLRDYDVYKDFNLSTEKSIMQRYSNLAEKYKISEKSIRLIVANMKKPI